jgi:ABC-type polar amino acid transport system ATPase subunit
MKKKAIDFKKYADMHENKEIVGTDGTKVVVRDHISYANKVAMAVALVEENVMIHDDSVCYESFAMPAERIKGIMKYYTDVPVDDADAQEVADFAINNGLIGQIRDSGITVLLIEQNAKKALSICDYAYVLENGRIKLSGTGKELLESDEVRKAYLGG